MAPDRFDQHFVRCRSCSYLARDLSQFYGNHADHLSDRLIRVDRAVSRFSASDRDALFCILRH